MIELSAPTPFVGGLLERQLHAAGLTNAQVALSGSTVVVAGVEDAQQPTVEVVLADHPATAQAALDAASAAAANETAIRDAAQQALAVNKTFLALTNPTNAQVAAQVKALTRQNTALIRLAFGRFDAAD